MIWLARYWKPLAALVLLGLAYGWGYTTARTAGLYALQVERTRAEKVIAESARAEAAAQAKARKAEQAKQAAVDAIAAKYEQEKTNAQASADRLIADLRAGNVRLRQLWRDERATDRLSDSAEAARRDDEIARLREQAAGRIIGIGAEADAQVRALQNHARAVSGQ